MNRFRFVIKSFTHFKKQHLAVFFATLISTAVLTGALIVGDSVKYSLKKLVDTRLGKIEYAMISGDRFVSSELSVKISNDLKLPTASVMMLQGIAINSDKQKRLNKVQILGVDNDFWTLSDIVMPDLKNNEIIISQNLSEQTDAKLGDELLIRIQNASAIPINAPFTTDENQSIALRLTIKHIANDNELGRFSFRNNQEAPYNIFINKSVVGKALELEGLSNLIVAKSNNDIPLGEIENSLRNNWTLKDAGLRINYINNNEIELISNRIFIDSPIIDGVEQLTIPNEKILTYFVNSFKSGENETPYSFITAAPDSYVGEELSNSEMIINSWLAEDLNVKIGDSIYIKYYVIGALRALEEKSANFIIKNIIPIKDSIFNKNLMPDFPGLSDAGSCSDWDAGIPIDLKEIRDKDEEYWNVFKGTPKAFVSLEKGLELWNNKFGSYTSIRFNVNNISES